MTAFRYLIIGCQALEVSGTNDRAVADEFKESDDFIVVDSATGYILTGRSEARNIKIKPVPSKIS